MEKREWFQTNPADSMSLMNPFDGAKIETPSETYILHQVDNFVQTFCFHWVHESRPYQL